MSLFRNPYIIVFFVLLALNIFTFNYFLINLLISILICRKIILVFKQVNQYNIVSAEFKNGFIYSPISGFIEKIDKRNEEIVITCRTPFFLPAQICLPVSGKIINISNESEDGSNILGKKNIFNLKIKTKHIVLKINIKSPFFNRFNSILRAGDIGKGGALISMMPLFSRLEVVVPFRYTINVEKGDKVSHGITPLATWE